MHPLWALVGAAGLFSLWGIARAWRVLSAAQPVQQERAPPALGERRS